MKFRFLVVFAFVLTLSGCIIFPEIDTKQAPIEGTILSSSGEPVSGAEIYLLPINSFQENLVQNKVLSDENGAFFFKKKTRIDWLHKYHLLARVKCRARIEIRAEGYKPKIIEFKNEGKHYTQDICKGVKFSKEVKLEKNN